MGKPLKKGFFMDIFDRIMELSAAGYYCSQILAIILLEVTEEENDGLVKAMGGLCGGVGYSNGCCGCMTGGCCLISYFTGRGGENEMDLDEHKPAMKEFTDWFTEEMQMEHGGIECADIIRGNPAKRVQYCPQIIAASFEKCMEILQNRGII